MQKLFKTVVGYFVLENAKFNSVIWSVEVARNLMYALGFEQVRQAHTAVRYIIRHYLRKVVII